MKPGQSIKVRRRWALVGAWVFAVGWAVFVYFMDNYIIGRIARQFQTGGYSSVEGTVLSCAAKEVPTDEGISYRVDIEYTYWVHNQEHTGRRVDYRIFVAEKWVSGFVAAHPGGSKVTVFYDPDNPARAVLIAGWSGEELFVLLCALPFNLIGLLLLGFAAVYTRGEEALARLSSGIRIIDRREETRIRLPRWPPALAAFMILTACSFPAIFLALCGAINSSVEWTATVWVLLIGTAVVVYLRLAWQVVAGKADLVIHRFGSRLTLPRTFGRKHAIEVPFTDVHSDRRDYEKTGRHGGRSLYPCCHDALARPRGASARRKVGGMGGQAVSVQARRFDSVQDRRSPGARLRATPRM